MPSLSTWLYASRRHIVQFARCEDGSNTVEAMLMIPLFVWSFLSAYVFFDAYRVQSINAKAGYTIGDIISRETGYITPAYMDSMHNLQQSLVDSRSVPRLRVTVFEYDAASNSYLVCWSRVRGGGPEMTDGRLAAISHGIPEHMRDGEQAILVQSQVNYEPIFAAGIAQMDFDDFVVTSPRLDQVLFHPINAGGNQTTGARIDCT